MMTTYRSVTLTQDDEEGDEYETIFIVPSTTSTADIISEDESAEIICQAFSDESADLIVDLLNKHYARKEMN